MTMDRIIETTNDGTDDVVIFERDGKIRLRKAKHPNDKGQPFANLKEVRYHLAVRRATVEQRTSAEHLFGTGPTQIMRDIVRDDGKIVYGGDDDA